LRRILDHRYSLLCREFPDANHIGWVSVQVRHDYRVDTAPDRRAQRIKIGTQCRRIYVVEPNVHACSESGGREIDAGVGGIRHGSTRGHDSP
jgi:hypothetical protein